MSVDELTDDEFFKLYQTNPQVKGLVEDIQRKYNVHSSQTNNPKHKDVSAATKEAKETINNIIHQQKGGHVSGDDSAEHEKPKPHGFSLPALTRPQTALGLGLTFIVLAALSLYAPVAIPAIAYSAPVYGL